MKHTVKRFSKHVACKPSSNRSLTWKELHLNVEKSTKLSAFMIHVLKTLGSTTGKIFTVVISLWSLTSVSNYIIALQVLLQGKYAHFRNWWTLFGHFQDCVHRDSATTEQPPNDARSNWSLHVQNTQSREVLRFVWVRVWQLRKSKELCWLYVAALPIVH